MANSLNELNSDLKIMTMCDILAKISNLDGNMSDKIYFKMLKNMIKLKKCENFI